MMEDNDNSRNQLNRKKQNKINETKKSVHYTDKIRIINI